MPISRLYTARAGVLGLAVAALIGAGSTAASAAPNGSDVRAFDWSNATLTLPRLDDSCPGGAVTFESGYASVDIDADGLADSYYWQNEVVFGRLDGDSREDALINVPCAPRGDFGRVYNSVHAFTVRNGKPVHIGVVTAPTLYPTTYEVRDGRAIVNARTAADHRLPELRFAFRFDGHAFREVSGKSAYTYDLTSRPFTLPFKADAPLDPPSNGRSCPQATLTLENSDRLARRARVMNGTFQVTAEPVSFGDVNRDGVTDMVVRITCSEDEVEHGMSGNAWHYVYTMRNNKPALLGFLTADAAAGKNTMVVDAQVLDTGRVQVVQGIDFTDSDRLVTRTFHWNGGKFHTNTPLPAGYEKSDVAP